jgi:ZIP family zinc transporter
MLNIQNVFASQLTNLQSNPYYQKIMALPQLQRWAAFCGIFLLSQILIFGSLYIIFGKIVVIGFLASILAGLATGLGALPVLFFKEISSNLLNGMLGLAAGVMLAATSFALIVPGIESGNTLWPDNGVWVVAAGMLLGAFFLHLSDKKLPHLHFGDLPDKKMETLQRISLFIIAITIHNFPEGMSVGVSFGNGDIKNGMILATAIGIQNIPEGLAVALPLVGLGFNKWKAIGIATLTGLVEPVGGLLGITMVTVFTPIIPIAMGFAAGAMLFVISEEIIPETHASGRSRIATFALMVGFIIMLALEEVLG